MTATATTKGLLGTKLGMTQVWDEAGRLVPVTVVQVGTNVVTQVRSEETDGYAAVQLAFGAVRRPQERHRFARHVRCDPPGRHACPVIEGRDHANRGMSAPGGGVQQDHRIQPPGDGQHEPLVPCAPGYRRFDAAHDVGGRKGSARHALPAGGGPVPPRMGLGNHLHKVARRRGRRLFWGGSDPVPTAFSELTWKAKVLSQFSGSASGCAASISRWCG